MSEETKVCPFCGEEILATAKKCKNCGEWLDGSEHRNNFFNCIVNFFTSKEFVKKRNTVGTVIILLSLVSILFTYISVLSDDSAVRQCVYALFLVFNALCIIVSMLLIDKEK